MLAEPGGRKAVMTYLFGDATPSELQVDYIRLLRDVVDLSVDVLSAWERIGGLRDDLRARVREMEADGGAVRELGRRVLQLLAADTAGDDGNPTTRCASAIARATSAAIDHEITRLGGVLSEERQRIERAIDDERAVCEQALERFALRGHALPDQTSELVVQLDGDTYAAQLTSETPLGLTMTVALDIPDGHALAAPARVEQLAADLEIGAPESRGWLSKKVKIVPHKLARYVITSVTVRAGATAIELRAAPDSADGFDVELDDAWTAARLTPVGHDHDGVEAFEVSAGDHDKLTALRDALVEALAPVREAPRALLEARLDGEPFARCEDPTVVVDRLVELLAPAVQEIAKHSLKPDELVLKRSLGGDRREEIFVTKGELRAKLDPLPASARARFRTLGLVPIGVGGKLPPPPPRPTHERTPTMEIDLDAQLEITPPPTPTERASTADPA